MKQTKCSQPSLEEAIGKEAEMEETEETQAFAPFHHSWPEVKFFKPFPSYGVKIGKKR